VNTITFTYSYILADGATSDTLLLPYLLNDIDAPGGVLRAESGYLSRDNGQLIEDLGATPFVKPKSHSRMMGLAGPPGGTCSSGTARIFWNTS